MKNYTSPSQTERMQLLPYRIYKNANHSSNEISSGDILIVRDSGRYIYWMSIKDIRTDIESSIYDSYINDYIYVDIRNVYRSCSPSDTLKRLVPFPIGHVTKYKMSKILEANKSFLLGDISSDLRYVESDEPDFSEDIMLQSIIIPNNIETITKAEVVDTFDNEIEDNNTHSISLANPSQKLVNLWEYVEYPDYPIESKGLNHNERSRKKSTDDKKEQFTEEEILEIAISPINVLMIKYNLTTQNAYILRNAAMMYCGDDIHHDFGKKSNYIGLFENGATVNEVIELFDNDPIKKKCIKASYKNWLGRKNNSKETISDISVLPDISTIDRDTAIQILRKPAKEVSRIYGTQYNATLEYQKNLSINVMAKDPYYLVFGTKWYDPEFQNTLSKMSKRKRYYYDELINRIESVKKEYESSFDDHCDMVMKNNDNITLQILINKRFAVYNFTKQIYTTDQINEIKYGNKEEIIPKYLIDPDNWFSIRNNIRNNI